MIDSLFHQLPIWLIALTFIFLFVFCAVTGLILLRKFTYKEHIRNSKDSIFALMNIVSILYAVLMAFLVVVVWENYDKNEDNVDSEGNYLSNMYRDCELLPKPVKDSLMLNIVTYCDQVTKIEWNEMEHGQSSDEVMKTISRIFNIFKNYQPETTKDDFVFSEMFGNFNHVLECRKIRILTSSKEIPKVLWDTIIACTIATLIFSYFFYFEKFRLHVILTAIISLMMALALLLVFILAHPFKGTYKIQPDSFQRIQVVAEAIRNSK